MIKRTVAACLMAITMVVSLGSVASAQDLVDSPLVDQVECLVIMTFNEGHTC